MADRGGPPSGRVVPSAWRFAAPPFGAAILVLAADVSGVLTRFTVPALVSLLFLALAVLAFFRDPDRTPPDTGIVAPADGRISVLRKEEVNGETRTRVGVFMNVTDVHVNRAPAAGTVESVTHRPGAHRPAFSKDSERNERVEIDCGDYRVSLIAGAFARRIHPYVEDGHRLARGERIGHIAFGSRADVVLPADVSIEDVRVEKGQRVRAGETVLVETEE